MPRCTGADMLTELERLKLVVDFQRLKNVTKVARNHGVSKDTVRRWVRRFEETQGVATQPGAGRKQSLKVVDIDKATEMLVSGKFAGVHQVAKELQQARASTSAKPVHRTTLSRLVKARGAELGVPVRALSGAPEKQLEEATKKKRHDFALRHKRTIWGRVMCTDRKKFMLRYPGCSVRRYTWVKKGGKRQARKASRLIGVNVYMGITKYGITKVHCVAGTHKQKTEHTTMKGQTAKSITKSEYKEVMEKTLLPEGNRIFRSAGMSSWVFQQDNDPSHSEAAHTIQAWNNKHTGVHVSLLEGWPGNSPDLNCIENLWAWAQARVDAHGCRNFDEFQKFVVETLQNVPKKLLESLVASMGRRIQACIEKKGDKTKY
jgi:transposase-like protein